VATAWHVSIEPDEMPWRQIDLSGLSAIAIEIGYEAFVWHDYSRLVPHRP
jgi:hypothetical protein